MKNPEYRLLNLELYRKILPISAHVTSGMTAPFTYHLRKNGTELLVIGVEHGSDTHDSQVAFIDKELTAFLKDKILDTCIVAVEGVDASKKFVPDSHGVSVVSVEPEQTEIAGWLRELGYTDSAIEEWGRKSIKSTPIGIAVNAARDYGMVLNIIALLEKANTSSPYWERTTPIVNAKHISQQV